MRASRDLTPTARRVAVGLALGIVACGARTRGLEGDLTTDGGRTPSAESLSCRRAKPAGAVTSYLSFPSARPGTSDGITSRGLGVVRAGQLAYAYRGSPAGDPGGVFEVTWPSSAGRISARTEPLGLVATSSAVSWSDAVGLQEFAFAGPQAGRQVLVRAGIATRHIAVDGGFVYALIDGSREGSGRLLRIDRATGDERVLATLAQDFRGGGVIVDDDRVLYAQSALTYLWSVRKDGSSRGPTPVQGVAGAPLVVSVQGLAFDGSDVFVPMSMTSGIEASEIAVTNKRATPGSDRRRIPAEGTIAGTFTAVFADTSGVYAAYAEGRAGASWILERYCPDGAFRVELARGEGVVPQIIADASRLYFTVDGMRGTATEGANHIHALPK